ncbi:hypothetical protein ACTXT7_008140 [Hymenolepis weldensis]
MTEGELNTVITNIQIFHLASPAPVLKLCFYWPTPIARSSNYLLYTATKPVPIAVITYCWLQSQAPSHLLNL